MQSVPLKSGLLVRGMAWTGIVVLTLAALFMVFYPIFTIMPFKAQTPGILSLSYALRRWSPVATVVIFAAVLALSIYLWRSTRRWWLKPAAALALIPVFAVAVISRLNHFELLMMFAPLANSSHSKAAEAEFVADEEMVLAVELNGDAVAYPVRQLSYHHVVHDVVGGVPIVATY